MIEITPARLYKIGFVCFFIIGIMGLLNYVNSFFAISIWSKIGGLFSLAFNFALAFFFKYMISLEPSFEETEATDDINKLIKEVTNGGGKTNSRIQGKDGSNRSSKRSRSTKI